MPGFGHVNRAVWLQVQREEAKPIRVGRVVALDKPFIQTFLSLQVIVYSYRA